MFRAVGISTTPIAFTCNPKPRPVRPGGAFQFPYTTPGNHVASPGNAITSASAQTMTSTNGVMEA